MKRKITIPVMLAVLIFGCFSAIAACDIDGNGSTEFRYAFDTLNCNSSIYINFSQSETAHKKTVQGIWASIVVSEEIESMEIVDVDYDGNHAIALEYYNEESPAFIECVDGKYYVYALTMRVGVTPNSFDKTNDEVVINSISYVVNGNEVVQQQKHYVGVFYSERDDFIYASSYNAGMANESGWDIPTSFTFRSSENIIITKVALGGHRLEIDKQGSPTDLDNINLNIAPNEYGDIRVLFPAFSDYYGVIDYFIIEYKLLGTDEVYTVAKSFIYITTQTKTTENLIQSLDW